MRIALISITLLFISNSAYAVDNIHLFYEENSSNYYSVGVRTESENKCPAPSVCGMYLSVSLEAVNVYGQRFMTGYGHFRLALTPNATFSPYVNIGFDLLEAGAFLFSDGEISPKVDLQYGYGLRMNLGNQNAIGIYKKTSVLSGYTIPDGNYESYGIELIMPL